MDPKDAITQKQIKNSNSHRTLKNRWATSEDHERSRLVTAGHRAHSPSQVVTKVHDKKVSKTPPSRRNAINGAHRAMPRPLCKRTTNCHESWQTQRSEQCTQANHTHNHKTTLCISVNLVIPDEKTPHGNTASRALR